MPDPNPDACLRVVQPAPFAWAIEPVMIADERAYLVAFDSVNGAQRYFATHEHAELMRDRWVEVLSGLVLPRAAGLHVIGGGST